MSKQKSTATVYTSEPVQDEAYGFKVAMPARHVPPSVVEAANAFAVACARLRETEAARERATREVTNTRNRVIGEAYAKLHENAVIAEDQRLQQSDDMVVASNAKQVAAAHVEAARTLVRQRYYELKAAVCAAGPGWSEYLEQQLALAHERIEREKAEMLDALQEVMELEGLFILIRDGGEWRRQKRVAPVEVSARGKVRALQEDLAQIVDLSIRNSAVLFRRPTV